MLGWREYLPHDARWEGGWRSLLSVEKCPLGSGADFEDRERILGSKRRLLWIAIDGLYSFALLSNIRIRSATYCSSSLFLLSSVYIPLQIISSGGTTMRAHLLTLLIATLTTPIFAADFFSSIQSSIFSETSCISCLQRATALCGKDDIFDAHCICLGAGGTEIVRCFNSCSVDAQFRITGRFYTFCVPHFKDMCNGGEFVADKNVWEEACEKKKQDTP